jgi:hypothetical protein
VSPLRGVAEDFPFFAKNLEKVVADAIEKALSAQPKGKE